MPSVCVFKFSAYEEIFVFLIHAYSISVKDVVSSLTLILIHILIIYLFNIFKCSSNGDTKFLIAMHFHENN